MSLTANELQARCDERLPRLVDQAWHLYARSSDGPDTATVQPSMPILYFGDRTAYQQSPTRIITVGLNPSLSEFPTNDPWLRFPTVAGLPNVSGTSMLTDEEREAYVASLDCYFATEPYDWFDRSFEPVLKGADASYYARATSVALHTDIASPVPTNPTWSGLTPRRKRLYHGGADLWRDLVKTLAPDVIIVSVAREHLPTITPLRFVDWPELTRVDGPERVEPYIVREALVTIADKTVLVVFGRCVNVPFGSVDFAARERIGRTIVTRLALLRAERSAP